MAQKRMFDKSLIDSDLFVDLPISSQCLYFHLSMRADDEGFVGNVRGIMRLIGFKEEDLRPLLNKNFILVFESGVIVIKHWKLNNYLRNDRFKKTNYSNEKLQIKEDNQGIYDMVYQMETNGIPSIEENSIEENSIEDIYIVEQKHDIAKGIIDYLNLITNKHFKYTKSNLEKINARLKEGNTKEDFKIVIDKKYKEWKGTDFEKYLQPSTLFGTKFDNYLNQKIKNKKNVPEWFANDFAKKEELKFETEEEKEKYYEQFKAF